MARTIAILALPSVQLLDVSGPLDVFAQANTETGREAYALRVVACEAGPIRSSSGVRLLPDLIAGRSDERFDTLLIAGAPNASRVRFKDSVLAWIRASAAKSRRYGSVCTGAFALAAALACAYPNATIEADALIVRDGKLRTAAGVTAGLDLALALVEEDLGRELAMRVASQLVMFFKRPGGQLQFSRHGQAHPAGRSALQEVQRWVAANPAEAHSVDALAERAGLSPRHFARLFLAEVGITPAAWVELARIDRARELLESGHAAPKQVAALCGFANADTLRRSFARHLGVTPAEYRRRHGHGRA